MINERNTFLKRTTPRSPPNMNENTSSNIHSPLKISSQMVLSNDFSQTTNPKNRYNEFYENSKTEANKNNYYSEDRLKIHNIQIQIVIIIINKVKLPLI